MSLILIAILAALALGLTVAMFVTRNMMLGFPSGIFWGIMGAAAYQQSAATWDLYYLIFFASMGMLIFTIFAAYTLRKRDLAGPDADKGAFIDEGGGSRGRQQAEKRPSDEPSGEPVSSWGDIDGLEMHETEDKRNLHRADPQERIDKRKQAARDRAALRRSGLG